MKPENLSWKKLMLILTLLMLILPALPAGAQNIFDAANPAGKYIVTDYLNHKITISINKSSGSSGRGTITVGGRTLSGKWHVTDFNNGYYLCFETYDNVRITYALPSGSAKTDQIIISQDGRASYNISALLDSYEKDWVKARKATAAKKSGKKKKSKK